MVERDDLVPTHHLTGPVAVIGDVHGCSELLRQLLTQLGDMPVVVVGDLCDRGPDTRGVLDLLIARGALGVQGNHEEWFRSWCAGEGFDKFAMSASMKGWTTLDSYGVTGTKPAEVGREFRNVPLSHREWVRALPIALRLVVDGQPFWVAHAGVPPLVADYATAQGRSLAQVVPYVAADSPADLLWGTTHPAHCAVLDCPVIMGHVICAEPLDLGHVIAVDTGAGTVPGGRLTAVVLPERRFVTVG